MPQFLRNMVLACVGLMLMMAALTASLFIGLLLIGLGLGLWAFVALRRTGIIASRHQPQETSIIEAEYVVIQEAETTPNPPPQDTP